MDKVFKNPFEILGVTPQDDADTVKQAYRKKSRTCHPDLHPGDKDKEEEFKQLSEAYELLSDPEKRIKFTSQAGFSLRGGAHGAVRNCFAKWLKL